MRDFRQLKIWQHAQDLAAQIYPLTESFPTPERYSLTSQIRRAASSVPANIAEGAGRSSNREMLFHLGVAAGSLSELESHIDLAARLGFVEVEEALRVRESVRTLRKAIYRFRSSLLAPAQDGRRPGPKPIADS